MKTVVEKPPAALRERAHALALERDERAVDCFNALLAANPRDVDALVGRASFRLEGFRDRQGLWIALAVRDLDAALGSDPQNAAALTVRAKARIESADASRGNDEWTLAQLRAAVRDAEQATLLAPDDADAAGVLMEALNDCVRCEIEVGEWSEDTLARLVAACDAALEFGDTDDVQECLRWLSLHLSSYPDEARAFEIVLCRSGSPELRALLAEDAE